MGHVGDKLCALSLHLGQRAGHGVEGLGQIVQLVAVVAAGADPHVKLPLAELPGRVHHFIDRPGLEGGGEGGGNDGDDQHDDCGEEEDGPGGPPHLQYAGGVRRGQHYAYHYALVFGGDGVGPGGHVAALRVEAVQVGHTGEAAQFLHLLDEELGQQNGGGEQIDIFSVTGVDHLSVAVRQDHQGIGGLGDGEQGVGKNFVGHVAAEGAFHVLSDQLGQVLGVALHRVTLVGDDVAVGQQHKGGGQQGKGEKDDANHHK